MFKFVEINTFTQIKKKLRSLKNDFAVSDCFAYDKCILNIKQGPQGPRKLSSLKSLKIQ